MQEEYIAESEAPAEAGRLGALLASIAKWTGALVSLALIVGIVFWSYRLGVRDASELPVIRAGDGPFREQPKDPGGEQAVNTGLEVNKVLAGATPGAIDTQTQTAPPPEALLDGENPVAVAGEPAVGEGVDTAALAVPGSTQDALNAEGEAVTVRKPRSRPGTLNTSARPTSELDRIIAGTQPATGTTAPAPAPTPVSTVWLAQLGAFASERGAQEQWQKLTAANADLLGNRENIIEQSQSGGLTVYRLRVTGFTKLADSQAFCTALNARSVSCTPASGQ